MTASIGSPGLTDFVSAVGDNPKRFYLWRNEDVSGVSGTGLVAWGVMWPDGTVALRWESEFATTAIADSIFDVNRIYGHGGKTVIEWID